MGKGEFDHLGHTNPQKMILLRYGTVNYVSQNCSQTHELFTVIAKLLVMAALRSRCGHYIFAVVFFFYLFYSSPNLSGHRLDVYHTSTHGVALVRI